MSDTVIRVENLSKKYVIGHQRQERYTALRDVLAEKVRGIGNIFNRHAQEQDEAFEEFWALKDVSFEIKQGDRVGIIGRNGAGKSTLLKILSRITEPTSGKISIKGRVASLLEVGTGFHPELTGRENIFLNGAILGMDRVEIRKKFDEIVAFAEVEKFLDTPVKRYSSGMYVRLAFAVAAHLEPEILIVDEVLAVGDAQFQKKCLGKMEDVAEEGRTVLFVSHNMATIQKLCHSCIFLSQGQTMFVGKILEGVNNYIGSFNEADKNFTKEDNCDISIVDFFFQDNIYGEKSSSVIFDHSYLLTLKIKTLQSFKKVAIGLLIYNSLGVLISNICSPEESVEDFLFENEIQCNYQIPSMSLMPGMYYVSIIIRNNQGILFESDRVLSFEVIPSIIKNASRPYRSDHGIVRIVSDVEIIKKSQAFDFYNADAII